MANATVSTRVTQRSSQQQQQNVIEIIDLTCEDADLPSKRLKIARSRGNLTDEVLPMEDELNCDRLQLFRLKVCEAFQDVRVKSQMMTLKCLGDKINQNIDEPFQQPEMECALVQMANENQIMVSDGHVYLI